MEQVKVKIPPFTPTNYEVKNREYGETGGHCMVGTIEVYLPEIDKTVWMHCNREIAEIKSVDIDKDDYEGDSLDDTVLLVDFGTEKPEDVKQWFPIIREALNYTIAQEIAFSGDFALPVAWLPDSIRKMANPEYLQKMQKKKEWVEFNKEGVIVW